MHTGLLNNGNALEALLALVSGLPAAPLQRCPENVKRDFRGQLQRVMADLTEAVHAARGQTRLFVPDEPLTDASAATVSDKVGRGRSCCMHFHILHMHTTNPIFF